MSAKSLGGGRFPPEAAVHPCYKHSRKLHHSRTDYGASAFVFLKPPYCA